MDGIGQGVSFVAASCPLAEPRYSSMGRQEVSFLFVFVLFQMALLGRRFCSRPALQRFAGRHPSTQTPQEHGQQAHTFANLRPRQSEASESNFQGSHQSRWP